MLDIVHEDLPALIHALRGTAGLEHDGVAIALRDGDAHGMLASAIGLLIYCAFDKVAEGGAATIDDVFAEWAELGRA